MSKSQGVKTAVLKSHLSEYLNKVRKGQEITVLDRNTPIAIIIPFLSDQKLKIEYTSPEEDPSLLKKIKGNKFGKKMKSSLDLLLEDRDSR